MSLDQQRYDELVRRFRRKSTKDLWFSIHAVDDHAPERRLAGEFVLRERKESITDRRSKRAFWISIVSAVLAMLSLLVSLVSHFQQRQALAKQPKGADISFGR